MHEEYIRPQENGSHHYCREVAINNEKGKVFVLSENDFAFNVSHFSLNQLTNANHNFELRNPQLLLTDLQSPVVVHSEFDYP